MKYPVSVKKQKTPLQKTMKQKPTASNKQSIISKTIKTLLEMLTTVKLFHWNTMSYSQHKASDELYSSLNTNIDQFVEVYLGKKETRIGKMDKVLQVYSGESTTDFKEKIHEYRRFLVNMNRVFNKEEDSDLLTIRDEILINLNQFLYLMTFHGGSSSSGK